MPRYAGITAKDNLREAIVDLGSPDDAVLHEKAKFLMKRVEDELMEQPGYGFRDALSKMGKKVGLTTKEERIQRSLVQLGDITLSTFVVLNPISLNLPEDIKKTAEVTLSSVTYRRNIKDLQKDLRSIFKIEE